MRLLLCEEGVSSQAVTTGKTSTDPDEKAWEEPGAIADGEREPDDPPAVTCMDELGPLDLQLPPGEQWAPVARRLETPARAAPTDPPGDRQAPAQVRHCSPAAT